MPRPELDAIPDIYWQTFCFIEEINEVVSNLNLVISELTSLTAHPELWKLLTKSQLSKKYSAMVRMFFYELFRTKEIYNKYLKYLKKNKLLRQSDIQGYKDDFVSLFNDFIKIRNKMVHATFAFPGAKYQTLWLAEFAAMNNMAFISKKSGEMVSVSEAMKALCAEFYEVAYASGTALAKYFEIFSHACCQVVTLIKEGKVDFSDD